MVKLYIDGREVQVEKGSTILQACASIGIEIPRFCYHERLSIAGNCRMCLVEVEKSAKPVASCAMPVMENMKVFTNTNLVKKAREGVLEFLLINHPLDCPICDQGGECDLQDQAMIFGSDRGRFYEFKRGVDDKNLGPLVKTIMTRCIHCTRCIRFATEVAGVEDLGTTGRGRDTEVGTYIEKTFDSELSGNVIDLCPVGALTSKPYAFSARSWELKSTESIDVLDALGSNIRIDVRGSEIMRILPRLNEDINEEWISDKTRFSYDGLKRQRLSKPMIKKEGAFKAVSWKEAFEWIKHLIKSSKTFSSFSGPLVDVESLTVLRDFSYSLGTDHIYSTSHNILSADLRESYVFNTKLSNIEESDLCLLVGSNPRLESPMLNVRLRRGVLSQNMKVYTIGSPCDLTYPSVHLGNSLQILKSICEGRHYLCQKLLKAKRPSIIVGDIVLSYSKIRVYLDTLCKYVDLKTSTWNGTNILHATSSSVGTADLGIVSSSLAKNMKFDFSYLVGVDEVQDLSIIRKNSKYIVYQGHHGDAGALVADVILPGSAYTEKESTYINTEGKSQKTKMAFYPPGDSRDDWKVIRALSEFVGINLPYSNAEELKERILQLNPHHLTGNQEFDLSISSFKNIDNISGIKVLPQAIDNFYMTDSITRASQIMAKCSKKTSSNYIRYY